MADSRKYDFRLMITIFLTIIVFAVSYFCLSNQIYSIYQNLYYIPIIYSCFWYRGKGLIYSICISAVHFLFFLGYNPEPLWQELARLIVFVVIGLITYRLAARMKKDQLKIMQLNKRLNIEIERFKKAEMLSRSGNYEADLETGKVIWSDELYRIFGYEPNSFEPAMTSRLEFTYPEDRSLVSQSVEKAINEKCSFQIENRIVRKDGSIGWVLSTGYVMLNEQGVVESYVGTLLDISTRKQLEKDLEREKERLRITIASIGDGVISTDINGNVVILNKVAEKLTGWSQKEARGKPIEEVFYIINEKTRTVCENPVQKVIESGLILGLANHTALISKNGKERSIADSAAPIIDRDGDIYGAILVFRDVTAEKKKQEKIYYMSFYDSLTGLHNRRYFEEEFRRIDAKRNLPISVIMGDANGLKLINDAIIYTMQYRTFPAMYLKFDIQYLNDV